MSNRMIEVHANSEALVKTHHKAEPTEVTTEELVDLVNKAAGDSSMLLWHKTYWYVETREKVSPEAAETDEAVGTPAEWMQCTSTMEELGEIERILDFRREKHPDMEHRIARKDEIHTVVAEES